MVYDPVKRHLAIEKLVTRYCSEGQEKKYYRIRRARWYGGIVTADCVGCGLLCRFCWVADIIMSRPSNIGRFYDPEEIAEKLISLARKCGLKLLRISGGEPTLGKTHLLQLLENLDGEGIHFILETNGIPIAYDSSYALELSKYKFIHVRVSLKGCTQEEFSMLTGAKPEGFELQLKSLKMFIDNGVSCHPSVMASFSHEQALKKLMRRLEQISPEIAENLEIEELILYPHVVRRLREYGLRYHSWHLPDNVPKEQI
ncbi:MAG: radical SAM protein [Candidatus Bathyarchaeia archaeon]